MENNEKIAIALLIGSIIVYIGSIYNAIKNNNEDDVHIFIPFILSAISLIITGKDIINRDKTTSTITKVVFGLSFIIAVILWLFIMGKSQRSTKTVSKTKSYINTTTPNIQPSYMPSTNIGGRRRR
jgi:hypothetical protein